MVALTSPLRGGKKEDEEIVLKKYKSEGEGATGAFSSIGGGHGHTKMGATNGDLKKIKQAENST